MMILSGAWIEWTRAQRGAWDPWFLAAMAMGFLLAFAAVGLRDPLRKWAVRGAAYLVILPPVGLFAAAAARAAGWL
jgi:hypothetical protein